MTKEQIDKAIDLGKKLNDIEKSIEYINRIKSNTSLGSNNTISIGGDVAGCPVRFKGEYKDKICDYVISLLNDGKKQVEDEIEKL